MEEDNRVRYNRLVNQCLNLKLKEQYGLKAESVIEYCDDNQKKVIEDDGWNIFFYAVVCTLILLVTMSSLYDFYLKTKLTEKQLTDHDHYRARQTNFVDRAFLTFSLPRNWYRLNQEPNGKLGRDFRFLDTFKFFSMFLVIFAHTNWVLYEGAMSNPQDPERMLHTPVGTLILSGGLITTTFFVTSGLLLTFNWLEVLKAKPVLIWWEYFALFIVFQVFRYIRLMGPYAFGILASGVYFDSPGGPMWRHIYEREQLACRKNWWTNLIFVNNYVNNDQRCLLQGWYLSADTHCFVLSLLILMIIHKWPKIRTYVIGALVALYIAGPGVLTYVNNYNPVFIPRPQTQKDSFIDDDDFTNFYAPFEMNFGCYFFGVLAALVYNEITARNFKLRSYKMAHVIWYALIPAGVFWMLTAHPLLQYYYDEPPRFWGAVYASLQRNMWGLGLGIVFLGMSARIGGIFRKFCCHPLFKVLGRLTYGAFGIHLIVIRVVLATAREPMFVSTNMMLAYVIFSTTASYLLSLIIAILIELPSSAILGLATRSF